MSIRGLGGKRPRSAGSVSPRGACVRQLMPSNLRPPEQVWFRTSRSKTGNPPRVLGGRPGSAWQQILLCCWRPSGPSDTSTPRQSPRPGAFTASSLQVCVCVCVCVCVLGDCLPPPLSTGSTPSPPPAPLWPSLQNRRPTDGIAYWRCLLTDTAPPSGGRRLHSAPPLSARSAGLNLGGGRRGRSAPGSAAVPPAKHARRHESNTPRLPGEGHSTHCTLCVCVCLAD